MNTETCRKLLKFTKFRGLAAVNSDDERCPITLKDFREHDVAWRLKVKENDIEKEEKYFYEIMRLAQHLERNQISPMTRLPVVHNDRVACIKTAKELLNSLGEGRRAELNRAIQRKQRLRSKYQTKRDAQETAIRELHEYEKNGKKHFWRYFERLASLRVHTDELMYETMRSKLAYERANNLHKIAQIRVQLEESHVTDGPRLFNVKRRIFEDRIRKVQTRADPQGSYMSAELHRIKQFADKAEIPQRLRQFDYEDGVNASQV